MHYDRKDLKLLREMKHPMCYLRNRMKIFAQGHEEYKKFEDEINVLVEEQEKFVEGADWMIAVSESFDKGQVMVVQLRRLMLSMSLLVYSNVANLFYFCCCCCFYIALAFNFK